ncbi:MAG: GMC family oxidoreductase, partial [Alphaproteobacteria bacterium]|nr:GMC family oxidoreductase [Alphaproteobacteria bacterium]
IERRQRARAVAVAGNAIETPRLLLNSATNRSPDGLANSSGHLGRHYMRHVMGYVYGVFGRPVNAHRGTPCAGILEDERPHDPARGFAGGYVLGAMALSLPSYAAYLRPAGWGAAFAADVEAYGYVSGTFANGEDMPMAGNAIALHPTERDGWGLPIPLITINEHPCDIALRNHALKAASAIQVAAGAQRVIECPPMPGSHNMGTARMSATPRDGVVDGWGCCHDVRNLFVSDGSAFPTAGGGNPTLTIVALALRQAGHIAERMRRNEL